MLLLIVDKYRGCALGDSVADLGGEGTCMKAIDLLSGNRPAGGVARVKRHAQAPRCIITILSAAMLFSKSWQPSTGSARTTCRGAWARVTIGGFLSVRTF
jgi:hypothetical protein